MPPPPCGHACLGCSAGQTPGHWRRLHTNAKPPFETRSWNLRAYRLWRSSQGRLGRPCIKRGSAADSTWRNECEGTGTPGPNPMLPQSRSRRLTRHSPLLRPRPDSSSMNQRQAGPSKTQSAPSWAAWEGNGTTTQPLAPSSAWVDSKEQSIHSEKGTAYGGAKPGRKWRPRRGRSLDRRLGCTYRPKKRG